MEEKTFTHPCLKLKELSKGKRSTVFSFLGPAHTTINREHWNGESLAFISWKLHWWLLLYNGSCLFALLFASSVPLLPQLHSLCGSTLQGDNSIEGPGEAAKRTRLMAQTLESSYKGSTPAQPNSNQVTLGKSFNLFCLSCLV